MFTKDIAQQLTVLVLAGDPAGISDMCHFCKKVLGKDFSYLYAC